MAGIYIHIPLCRQRCIYCDFYSTTREQDEEDFVDALCHEIALSVDYLKGQEVQTIYWGGGTPSLLKPNNISRILACIATHHTIAEAVEHTFEANPDDLTKEYLKALVSCGVNRLSLGVQSFHDEELAVLHRRHDAAQAVRSIELAQDLGLSNISIDLIYGLPQSTVASWEYSLRKALALSPTHFSAYILGYEPGTLLYKKRHSYSFRRVAEELVIAQFESLLKLSEVHGFEQYEISNFAREQSYSRHNMSYWQGVDYFGLGPSAHSYNGNIRRWNKPQLKWYIASLKQGAVFYEQEVLGVKEKFNEFLMTRLRMCCGMDMLEFKALFGDYEGYSKVLQVINNLEKQGRLKVIGGRVVIPQEYLLVSDQLIVELLY